MPPYFTFFTIYNRNNVHTTIYSLRNKRVNILIPKKYFKKLQFQLLELMSKFYEDLLQRAEPSKWIRLFLFCGLRNSLTCFWEKLGKKINLVQFFFFNSLTCIFQEIEEKKLLWVIKKIFRRFIVVSWQYMCRPSGIDLPDRLGELLFFN